MIFTKVHQSEIFMVTEERLMPVKSTEVESYREKKFIAICDIIIP